MAISNFCLVFQKISCQNKIFDNNLNKIYQTHTNHHVRYHNSRISYFYLYLSVVAATFLFTLKLKNLHPNLLAATMSKGTRWHLMQVMLLLHQTENLGDCFYPNEALQILYLAPLVGLAPAKLLDENQGTLLICLQRHLLEKNLLH